MRKVGKSRTVGDAAIASVTAVALLAGIWLLQGADEPASPPQPTAAQAAPGTDQERFGPPALPPSPPDRIRIPSLHVDAPLTGLGLTGTGALQAPPAAAKNLAGWYENGATPGEAGTAVVVGHVDNTTGPAVFYDLGALKKGSTIDVHRRDGSTAVFTVYAVQVFQRKDFPDAKVYGPAARPELRVITCGGGYSRRTGYRGNVVVFARFTVGHPALTLPLRLG
ncbi:class F sortase [Streptomyces sp. NPDC003631]|uniref:class F sortase n=1 Tax=Streptomyces sp. NPDC093675 TaxID=3366049 RepID=UPI0037FBA450